MKPTVYALICLVLLLTGCEDYGENLCDSYPGVMKEIRENKQALQTEIAAFPESGKGRHLSRKPASSVENSWAKGLVKKLQWARDHFEGSVEKAAAFRDITEAADQTLFLAGYLEQGKKQRGLESLTEIESRLESAFASGCPKK